MEIKKNCYLSLSFFVIILMLCISLQSVSATGTPGTNCKLSRSLKLGMRGTDVLCLQTFLKEKGFLIIDTPTNFFGYKTFAAVKAFQKAPTPAVPSTGFVGQLTLAKIADVQKSSSSFTAACTATPTGQTIAWAATPTGGVYEWSGDASGTSFAFTNSYSTAGLKNAQVRITLNGSSAVASCSTIINSSAAVAFLTSSSTFAPTPITTCTELQNIKNNLAIGYYLANDIDCSSILNFQPIANFTGFFDGQGHTITGLAINRTAENNVGLFGSTNNSTIKNVILKDFYVGGKDYVGLLVGKAEKTTISQVSVVFSTFNYYHMAGLNYVGGLVGYSSNSNISKVSVVGLRTPPINYLGGLVGRSEYSKIDNSFSNIGWFQRGATSYVGGIAGYNGVDSSIVNSYSTGLIYSGGSIAGGLAGYNRGKVINSFTTIQPLFTASSIVCGGGYADVYSIGGPIGKNLGYINNIQWYNFPGNCPRVTGSGNSCSVASSCIYQSSVSAFYSTANAVYAGDTPWDFTNDWQANTSNYPTLINNYNEVDLRSTRYFNFNNAENVVFENKYGRIKFTQPISGSGNNLDDIVTLWDHQVGVMSNLQPGFNKPAQITFYNTHADSSNAGNIIIWKNYSRIAGNIIRYDPLTFTVDGFTYYNAFVQGLEHRYCSVDAAVTLAWDPPVTNTDSSVLTDLAGYKLYQGGGGGPNPPVPGVYTIVYDNIGLVTNFTVTNLVPGATYYFVGTAVNSAGRESVYSDELMWRAPDDCRPMTIQMPKACYGEQYMFTWNVPTSRADGKLITGPIVYELSWGKKPDEYDESKIFNTNQATLFSLMPNTTYYFKLEAIFSDQFMSNPTYDSWTTPECNTPRGAMIIIR